MEEAHRQREAAEIVRTYQQGFGKPIISVQHGEFRIVAVSNRIKWSRGWRWFTDFLLDHLKDSIGREWATQALREGMEHPLFRWLRRMNDHMKANRPLGMETHRSEEIGFLTSIFRLGYALYLIDHHDQLDPILIRRLRSPRQFLPAYYETLLASAFAVAGATIKMAETRGVSTRTPEFWATGRSGTKYAIEAKCKAGWKSVIDPGSDEFRAELRQWLRDQIYRASKKHLANGIYCFELSIPEPLDMDEWENVRLIAAATIKEAEAITIHGAPASPAYILVTNHPHLVNDDAQGITAVVMLEGYRLSNFASSVELPLETALEWHDAHRDIYWVLKCMEEVQRIPPTFDGVPAEFVWAKHQGRGILKIGEKVDIDFPDGPNLKGVLRDVCSSGATAYVVVEAEDGQQHIASIPLNQEEAEAARAYGDAIFGKPEKRRRDLGDDPLALYDWFLEVYSTYSVESLLRQIPEHPNFAEIAELPRDQMAIRVAREVTKGAIYQMQRPQSEESTAPAAEAGTSEQKKPRLRRASPQPAQRPKESV